MTKIFVTDAFLGRDIVIRDSKNGKKFASMTACSNDFFAGEEKTQWFDITWFEYNENITKHLKKGSCIHFGGAFCSENETGADGVTRNRLRVICDFVTFAGGKKSDDATSTNGEAQPKNEAASAAEEMPSTKGKKKTTEAKPVEPTVKPLTQEEQDDDLPF